MARFTKDVCACIELEHRRNCHKVIEAAAAFLFLWSRLSLRARKRRHRSSFFDGVRCCFYFITKSRRNLLLVIISDLGHNDT